MSKFYVASSFQDKETVRYVNQYLKDKGFTHTYDWTQNERASTFENLKSIGHQERNAVLESDFIIVILPAGKGSHIKLGIALGQGKKIYLYSPDGEVNNFDTTSTFYHLPEVSKSFGTIENLLEKVTAIEYDYN
ncbi:nucleoside 2-deoxyribosyltransferase [Bacillus aquiflavi]|uniref:Group-specific protein n=1 Tax=Bacillus aquiflavi TaxID=2672567 RepID=A0A6B3VVJ2_9BACI|nr:nucleoside 2-deoxyribosyltransferase [Bacillus aquiflavi]MBA4535932.1 nucleoside 2-deoxyribosyltransferase [Bacillus aquiflavi]NEY80307.1 group-specific protein [Bacillus aquiflavi]UAC49824.1 nucleoside 2-deoxyribosyltransferase [Bacillus aquiflavi]